MGLYEHEHLAKNGKGMTVRNRLLPVRTWLWIIASIVTNQLHELKTVSFIIESLRVWVT